MVVAIAATIALITRLARLTGPDRPVIRPVLLAIAAAGGLSIVSSLTLVIPLPHSTVITVDELEGLALASVPVAFLAASARKWLARERVLALIASLGPAPTPGQVQDVLRTALGDPTLTLLYQVSGVSGGLVDTGGVPTAPIAPAGGAVIPAPGGVVLLTGEPLLARYPELVRAAASVAGLALQNTSLQAAISAQIYLVGQSAASSTPRSAPSGGGSAPRSASCATRSWRSSRGGWPSWSRPARRPPGPPAAPATCSPGWCTN